MNVYVLLCLAAVAVVGLIEWVKNLVEKFLTVPGWVWSVVVWGLIVKKLISVLALLIIAGLLFSNWWRGRQIDKLSAQSGTLSDSQAALVVV